MGRVNLLDLLIRENRLPFSWPGSGHSSTIAFLMETERADFDRLAGICRGELTQLPPRFSEIPACAGGPRIFTQFYQNTERNEIILTLRLS